MAGGPVILQSTGCRCNALPARLRFYTHGIDWFMLNDSSGYQIMGNDYYGRNEQLLLPDGTILQSWLVSYYQDERHFLFFFLPIY